jgi:hypothetical protein
MKEQAPLRRTDSTVKNLLPTAMALDLRYPRPSVISTAFTSPTLLATVQRRGLVLWWEAMNRR